MKLDRERFLDESAYERINKVFERFHQKSVLGGEIDLENVAEFYSILAMDLKGEREEDSILESLLTKKWMHHLQNSDVCFQS